MIVNGNILDFEKLNKYLIENSNAENRLQKAYEIVGGEFWDEEKTIMKGAKVFVIGVGGMLLRNDSENSYLMSTKIDKGVIKKEIDKMAGVSSFMSYLNTKDSDLEDLGNSVVNAYNHKSVLHTVALNILVIGNSIGVEHELSTQRDLVHLSRLTVSRTKVQENPCLTLTDPVYYDIYKEVKENLDSLLSGVKAVSADEREVRNLLYPNAKASMVIMSGSLRNFYKIIDMKNDTGKEKELVEILKSMNDVISNFIN